MSVVGRGKGRGFVEIQETSLRRPGQPLSSKFNDLINLIDNLVVSDQISSTKINEIIEIINESIQNNSLKETVDSLYKQAVRDRQFGTKLAILCSNSKVYSINANQFRRILMTTIQQDYEEREEIKKKNIIHFRNAISFLGKIYNSLNCNGPLQFLAVPLLDYLEILLEASEEEDIEITMIQISINGQNIYEKYPTQLEDFIMRVKTVLINRNLSARSRGMLLYIIDLFNKCFVLSGKLLEFYMNELGTDIFINIQGSNKDLSVITKLKYNINYKYTTKTKLAQSTADDNFEGALAKTDKQGKCIEFGSDEKNSHIIINERLSVPRAIRGTGAVDSIKDKNIKKLSRGRKDKLTDQQLWSSKQNTNSKVWGHDDRFDKDYV